VRGSLLPQSVADVRRAHPVLLAELARAPFIAAVTAEVAFFIIAAIGSVGVPSISYPAALRLIEVVAILAIIVGIAMLFIRSRYMPLVALVGTLLAIPVAVHDRSVPGQRGLLEIVVLGIFAFLWLAIAIAGFASRPKE
jgi:hypothetical protein